MSDPLDELPSAAADDDAAAEEWLRHMANLPDDQVRELLVDGGWLKKNEGL